MYPTFKSDIERMNKTYKLLPIADAQMLHRLQQFRTILTAECSEIDELIEDAEVISSNITTADVIRVKTGLADLLGDIIVYCTSEAARWNIPIGTVLQAIMASNFSKLDENGEPIINPDTGKFEKGPNYWKPEPLIAKILQEPERPSFKKSDAVELAKKCGALYSGNVTEEIYLVSALNLEKFANAVLGATFSPEITYVDMDHVVAEATKSSTSLE